MPSKKEATFERLRTQKRAASSTDEEQVSAEWLDSLDSLMTTLKRWLEEAKGEGLLDIESLRVQMKEPRLGEYEAPALRLTTPLGDVIRITPRARYVVGAFGRVDLEYHPPHRATLVRTQPDRWQFAWLTPTPEGGGWVFVDLTEDSFWQAIDNLLGWR